VTSLKSLNLSEVVLWQSALKHEVHWMQDISESVLVLELRRHTWQGGGRLLGHVPVVK
jgi:hypothetical protein